MGQPVRGVQGWERQPFLLYSKSICTFSWTRRSLVLVPHGHGDSQGHGIHQQERETHLVSGEETRRGRRIF